MRNCKGGGCGWVSSEVSLERKRKRGWLMNLKMRRNGDDGGDGGHARYAR